MGTSVSRNEDLTENEILKRFVGKEAIPLDDADYWDTLLKYTLAMPKDRYDISLLLITFPITSNNPSMTPNPSFPQPRTTGSGLATRDDMSTVYHPQSAIGQPGHVSGGVPGQGARAVVPVRPAEQCPSLADL